VELHIPLSWPTEESDAITIQALVCMREHIDLGSVLAELKANSSIASGSLVQLFAAVKDAVHAFMTREDSIKSNV
jgi:hypothetical protein